MYVILYVYNSHVILVQIVNISGRIGGISSISSNRSVVFPGNTEGTTVDLRDERSSSVTRRNTPIYN